MATVSTPTFLFPYIPHVPDPTVGTTLLIDASGEKVGIVFRASKAGNINKIHFYLSTVTTGQTLKASLQDVSLTTGFPDEVIDQSGTVAVADTDDNTWKTVTLGSSRTVAVGDLVGVVIEFDTTVGNLSVGAGAVIDADTCYTALKSGAGPAWVKQTRAPFFAIEYDDGQGCMIPGAYPWVSTTADISTSSTPDELGVKFVAAGPFRVAGLGMFGRNAGDFDLVLYDSGSTAVGTASLDKDLGGNNAGAFRRIGMLATKVTLTAGATYRLVVKPTSTTAIRCYYGVAVSAAMLDTILGAGQSANFVGTERKLPAGWTDTTTRWPNMFLLCDGISDGASSASGIGSLVGGSLAK